jgi:hypothetical protein
MRQLKEYLIMFKTNGTFRKNIAGRRLGGLLLLLGIVIFPSRFESAKVESLPTSYYVSPNGDDDNVGTIDQPWKTIQYAVTAAVLQPGDTIYLREGTYTEGQVIIDNGVSGTPGNNITLRNYPGEKPILSGMKLSFRDRDFIRVEGLEFKNLLVVSLAFQSRTRPVRGFEAVNNVFENTTQTPDITFIRVSTVGSDPTILPENYLRVTDVLIEGNEFLDDNSGIVDDKADALQVEGNVDHFRILNNTIRNTTSIGIVVAGRTWKNGDGVIRDPDDLNDDQSDYFLVAGNVVEGVTSSAIYLDAPGDYFIVENNLVFDNNQGIKVAGEGVSAPLSYKQGIVRFNLAYNNTFNANYGSGKNSAREYVTDCGQTTKSQDVVFVHNTFYSDRTGSAVARFYCGENLRFKNNIVSNVTDSADKNKLLQINQASVDSSTWEVDSNLYWPGAVEKEYQWVGPTLYSGFDEYRSGTGNDGLSSEANPMFVDASGRDFRLEEGSAAIDAAEPLTRTVSSGSGQIMPVKDARYFTDGLELQPGDLIRVRDRSSVRVTAVDYETHRLTLDRSLTWNLGDPVTYDFTGSGPDIGAFEFYPQGETTFADVPFDHPYHDEIEILYQAGYTAGCGTEPLRYCPDDPMERSHSAVFIVRGEHGAGVEPPTPANQVFADVSPLSWHFTWINQLWEDGFTAGCGTDPLIFCPDQDHTRAEAAVFGMRMKHGQDYVPPATSGLFDDLPEGWWGTDWAEAAYLEGLLPACSEAPLLFCPNDLATRGLGAFMIVQAKGLLSEPTTIPVSSPGPGS